MFTASDEVRPNDIWFEQVLKGDSLRPRSSGTATAVPSPSATWDGLTAEKNVRCLAQLEQALLARGHRDFRTVVPLLSRSSVCAQVPHG